MTWQKIPYADFLELSLPHMKSAISEHVFLLRTLSRPQQDSTITLAYMEHERPLAFAVTHGTHSAHWDLCPQAYKYAQQLVSYWQHQQHQPEVIQAVTECAAELAQLWHTTSKAKAHLHLDTNFYLLDKLITPRECAGTARLASMADIEAYAPMRTAFVREALRLQPTPEAAQRDAERAITQNRIILWEKDGEALGCAISSDVLDIGGWIGGVYTKSAYRGNGIAMALAAHICEMNSQANRFTCLSADAKLAHTNALYQQLGFVQTAQYNNWWLTYPTA